MVEEGKFFQGRVGIRTLGEEHNESAQEKQEEVLESSQRFFLEYDEHPGDCERMGHIKHDVVLLKE